MKSEPVMIVGVLVAIIQYAIRFFDLGTVDDSAVQGLATGIIVLIGAAWARWKVMPVATIKEAGLSPTAVQSRADNPSIPRHAGE